MYKIIYRSLSENGISCMASSASFKQCKIRKEVVFSPYESTRFIGHKTTGENHHSKIYALRKTWFSKYMDYIRDLQKRLEKSFPKTMHVYRVFSIGTKDFYNDLKQYFAVKKKKSIVGIDKLSTQELQLLYQMPKDIMKLTPFLLTAALPFANYVVFPIGYYFPRIFLTSQYWDLQQRLDFALIDHKNRLKHNKPLLRCVQASLSKIEDQCLKNKWNEVIATLGGGRHPAPEEIVDCKELFQGPPYSLKALGRRHVKELLAIHKMAKWLPYKRQRLLERGLLIKRMDNAIEMGGGVNKIPTDTLRWALFFRGLNAVNMSTEDMRQWLNKWLTVSSKVEKQNISLLLHCPILLAYNHETNWTLLYY
ncbi:LETM1 domain-containing protein 1 isoform X1 [Athalia rosae]|uniref:LETM1 domain-containing protein 1 isoform X1 n=1 Tax=Athalia rosae TaxID=37344 RepID=UPI00203482AD|nr:LETM1 domain-containing protein 1 isoform X1 [Athalia rosae]